MGTLSIDKKIEKLSKMLKEIKREQIALKTRLLKQKPFKGSSKTKRWETLAEKVTGLWKGEKDAVGVIREQRVKYE
ncbi:MAG: hypothetical protein AB1521_17120 [Bacteroidota bacterium]